MPLENAPFEDEPIDRRQFLRLSAAASGTLLLPGASTAQEELQSEKFTETYEFVVNHTPKSEPVETLLRLEDVSAIFQLREVVDTLRTTGEPELAAYVEPTPQQVPEIADIGAVTELQFSPGANPFWRLSRYEDGVFPEPRESTGLISFEEMVQGMQHLADQHQNRLRLRSVGESAGRYNLITHEIEPQDVWLFELTNDITDEEAFAEKEKVLVFNQDSDERQGPEAMFRFVEDVLTGEEPETEALLDDLVLLFMINNPDGWISKQTQYYSGDEVTEDQLIRVNEYKTLLPTGADPNRSYPTPGYISPDHFPAEPAGADLTDDIEGIDDDVPEYIVETVPGELDIAEYLRTRDYQNLEYALDIHGFGASDTFLEGFPLNGDYDFEDMQDLYALQRTVDEAVAESELEEMIASEELQDVFERLNERAREEGEDEEDEELPVPENTYKYGTLFDILGYSTTGDTISWMSANEENGGLGDIKTYATETVYSIGEFIPELVDAWVVANKAAIRATAAHATKEVDTGIQSGGASTAYVTSDSLVRSSDDLSFIGEETQSRTGYESASHSLQLSPGGEKQIGVDVSAVDREFTVTVSPGSSVEVEIRSPDGAVVQRRRFEGLASGFGANRPTVTVAPETSGEWTVHVENVRAGTQEVDVTIGRLQSDSENPNPNEVLGFSQREYEVSPFEFFSEYANYVTDDGEMQDVSIRDVEDGALVTDGAPAFDNVVLIHRDGVESEAYVSALDEYVASGGNLVLTDRGVHLLAAMENDLAGPFDDDHVSNHTVFTSFIGDRNDDHPLLAGTASSQLEVGKWIPLGYSLSLNAPMTLVDPEAFKSAGGSIAGTTSGRYKEIETGVFAGSLTQSDSRTGIHVVGGALPPATQDHLHPFGLNDYLLSHLGMKILSNALGFETAVSVTGG